MLHSKEQLSCHALLPVGCVVVVLCSDCGIDHDAGVLVECDPSIKAIIVKIDTEHHHDFIIEDIDDEHVLIKSNKHEELKGLLKDVSHFLQRLMHEPRAHIWCLHVGSEGYGQRA